MAPTPATPEEWLLEELIRHIKATPNVWFATHEEVARYCKEHA